MRISILLLKILLLYLLTLLILFFLILILLVNLLHFHLHLLMNPPTSTLHITPSIPHQPDLVDVVPTSHNVLSSPTSDTPCSIDLPPSTSTDIDPIPTSSSPIVLRRSTRPHHPPAYLTDYSCKTVVSKPSPGSPYDISNHLSYENLGSTFHSSVMFVTATPAEPTHFY